MTAPQPQESPSPRAYLEPPRALGRLRRTSNLGPNLGEDDC